MREISVNDPMKSAKMADPAGLAVFAVTKKLVVLRWLL